MLLLSRYRCWAPPRVVRCALAACALAVPLTAARTIPARAQENGFAQQVDEFRNAIGLGKDRPPIDFSERPPLAVPPTYTLPPPVAGGASLPVKDPDVDARRKALSDARRPVPPTDPGAHAAGLAARTYLVAPPAGFRDPRAVTEGIEVDNSPAAATSKSARKRKVRKPKPVAAAQ